MAKKKFDLELQVSTVGSVLKWEVFLENTNESSRVSNWANNENYYYKKLSKYSVSDGALDVFVGCEGKKGGKTTCTVVINNSEKKTKVTCKNTYPDYATESYII